MREHELQSSIIAECNLRAKRNPLYGRIFAVPNGGHRDVRVARKLKAEGVRPGVPDLMIPVSRHGYHGAFLELKISPNKLGKEQEVWMDFLRSQGYVCEVIYDEPEKVMQFIQWYLEAE